MLVQDEIITIFKQPIITFKYGRYLQAALLGVAATSAPDLAALRCLSILDTTEFKALFLELYTTLEITDIQKKQATSIVEISDNLRKGKRSIQRAIRELRGVAPDETITLLLNSMVTYSPVYLVAIATFTVTLMTLQEEGAI